MAWHSAIALGKVAITAKRFFSFQFLENFIHLWSAFGSYRSIFTSSPFPLVPSTPSPFQLHVLLFCCFSNPGPMSVVHIDMVVENSLGSLPLAMAPKENNVFLSLGQHQLQIALRRVGPQGSPPILAGILTVLITGAVNWAHHVKTCMSIVQGPRHVKKSALASSSFRPPALKFCTCLLPCCLSLGGREVNLDDSPTTQNLLCLAL